MNEELDKLRDLAIEVEKACYYPERKIKDGSPYTYRPIAFKLTDLAITLLGGLKKVDQMTLERKKKNPWQIQIVAIGPYGQS
jgi:hypothetical protein